MTGLQFTHTCCVCFPTVKQKAIPLFAYSDVDKVEISLMAAKIQDVEYKKGDTIAKIGQTVTPAIYIIRFGAVVSAALQ